MILFPHPSLRYIIMRGVPARLSGRAWTALQTMDTLVRQSGCHTTHFLQLDTQTGLAYVCWVIYDTNARVMALDTWVDKNRFLDASGVVRSLEEIQRR